MKQRGNYKSVLEIVQANTGMTEQELIDDKKIYILDKAKQAGVIIKSFFDRTIYVVGDYDVDGICAAAIFYLLLKKLGAKNIIVRLPRRFSEGYGMNPGMISEFEDGNLIVTVDNGIAAHEAIRAAKAHGHTVIVTDHHLPVMNDGEMILPDADLLIDPHAVCDNTDFIDYCGAGIAYKIAETMTDDVLFLQKLMGIAAVATIADCVPLVGENRRFVKNGLRYVMNKSTTTEGLSALIGMMKIEAMNTEKVSFQIAPALNAPGRLYDDGSEKSFRLLICENDADIMAAEIIEDNNRRKIMAKDGETAAITIAESIHMKPVVVYMPELCEGLCGIIAAKLAEKYQCPAIVFSGEKDVLKGSGRSYGGVNLKELLDSVAEWLVGYGGHADAAGLSIRRENIESLCLALHDALPEIRAEVMEPMYDLKICASNVDQTICELSKYEPYGEGNPAPVFLVEGLHLVPRGNSHYRVFTNDTGIKLYSEEAEITVFSSPERNAVRMYEDIGKPRNIDVIGCLATDTYLGKSKNQIIATEIISKETKKKQSSLSMLLQKRAAEGRKG